MSRPAPFPLAPTLFFVLAAAALSAAAVQDEEEEKPYELGSLIREELTFEDLKGKEHALFDEHEDQVLVLVWWSLRDPTCRTYERRLARLQATFAEEDVAVILIESNYDEIFHPTKDPLDRVRRHVEETKLALPLWVDREGTVAEDFATLCANQVFVIDRKRYVRYVGGIDDDPRDERKPEQRRTWLADALGAVVDGRKPELPLTRPKGRRISRKRK